jgi:protoporphyrinogen oxidase
MRLPFVGRKKYEALLTERSVLLDALRNANEELRKHRQLLATLRTGQTEMTEAVEKALAG